MNHPDLIFKKYNEPDIERKEISAEQLSIQLNNFKVLLYGAGSAGLGFLIALRKIGVTPYAFLDANPTKKDTYLGGIRILLPDDITDRQNCYVVVCINTTEKSFNGLIAENLRKNSPNELIFKLKHMGFGKVEFYHQFWRCYKLFEHERFPLPSCADVYSILKNKDKICSVFELFNEDLSNEIFLRYLEFRLIDKTIEIPTQDNKNKYLERQLFSPISNERFLDGGAFNGNTIEKLYKPLNIKNYIGIEPDISTFRSLENFVTNLNIEAKSIYNNALYSEISNENFTSFNGPGSLLHTEGETIVRTITIDSLQVEPTYIKLNIEGCEAAAIKGGTETIKKFTPILVVRLLKIYDFWEIPSMLSNICPQYSLFLRSYMNHLDFFLYAIPPSRINH